LPSTADLVLNNSLDRSIKLAIINSFLQVRLVCIAEKEPRHLFQSSAISQVDYITVASPLFRPYFMIPEIVKCS
jgi:hypothetical protein